MRAVAALEMRVPAFALRYNTLYERTGIHSDHRGRRDINEVVAVHLRRNGFACTQAFSGSEGRLLLSGSERSTS